MQLLILFTSQFLALHREGKAPHGGDVPYSGSSHFPRDEITQGSGEVLKQGCPSPAMSQRNMFP